MLKDRLKNTLKKLYIVICNLKKKNLVILLNLVNYTLYYIGLSLYFLNIFFRKAFHLIYSYIIVLKYTTFINVRYIIYFFLLIPLLLEIINLFINKSDLSFQNVHIVLFYFILYILFVSFFELYFRRRDLFKSIVYFILIGVLLYIL